MCAGLWQGGIDQSCSLANKILRPLRRAQNDNKLRTPFLVGRAEGAAETPAPTRPKPAATSSSVLPALQVRPCWRRLLHPLHHLRQNALVISGWAEVLAVNVLAGIAVRLARAVIEGCCGRRIG